MGRFSSVQSFADNHNAVRKVAYEQISGTAVSGSVAGAATTTASEAAGGGKSGGGISFIPPEKVVNPYGSTAGAGSGEFHIYRHSRNRELQRQKFMELSAAEQQLEQQYQQQLAENQEWEKERTAKRQKKRQRQKNAKKRKENLRKAGVITSIDEQSDEDDDGDEFQKSPHDAMKQTAALEEEVDLSDQKRRTSTTDKDGTRPTNTKAAEITTTTTPSFQTVEIPKDGSFLETMKQLLRKNKPTLNTEQQQ